MTNKGIVKWFDPKKGFGFIVSESLDVDIMVHYSEIKMEGFRTAQTGDRVVFEIDESRDKGISAKNVEILS